MQSIFRWSIALAVACIGLGIALYYDAQELAGTTLNWWLHSGGRITDMGQFTTMFFGCLIGYRVLAMLLIAGGALGLFRLLKRRRQP